MPVVVDFVEPLAAGAPVDCAGVDGDPESVEEPESDDDFESADEPGVPAPPAGTVAEEPDLLSVR